VPNLSIEDRKVLLNDMNQQLLDGQLTLGKAIHQIRTQLYGMSQAQYSAFVGLSEKTLRDIEKSNTDPRLSVLNKAFGPAKMTIVAHST